MLRVQLINGILARVSRWDAAEITESIPLAALKPPPPSPSGADQIGLQVGDDVTHGKFGDGVIIAIQGSGDKAEAVVNFRGIGEKRLLLAWAPLTKR
jgi:DNA helicase-2/ATP-dependent DNA helicase PcrA